MTTIQRNSFIQALHEMNVPQVIQTTTANGALSNLLVDPSLTHEGLVGLFYKCCRGIEDDMLYLYLDKLMEENMHDAILLAFYTRDCRGGKGERDIGRKCFQYIAQNIHGVEQLRLTLPLIPKYGRWDDLVVLSTNKDLSETIFALIRDRLDQDLHLRDQGVPTSMCAKWLPSEGLALDSKTKFVERFCSYANLTKATYRKKYLTPLRRHIDIVENRICKGQWDTIDFSRVPSCAMMKLSDAFLKHTPEKFEEWKDSLASGKTTVNAAQLFPHEVVHQYMKDGLTTINPLYEAQWGVLLEKIGSIRNSLSVCDVSLSMTSELPKSKCTCLTVAMSISIMLSQKCSDVFRGKVITFSQSPSFVELDVVETLVEKIKLLKKADWGANTNFQSVFDLILRTIVSNDVSVDDIPQRLFVLSDMQFDEADGSTNFEAIRNKFNTLGITMPQLIFWNISGSSTDFPVTLHENGTLLISGFSPTILKYIFELDELTPLTIARHVLDSERYTEVRALLEN